MKVKRLIALLAATTLTFPMLAGCGEQQTASSGEPYTIDWYFIGNDNTDEAVVENAINEYIATEVKDLNVKLDLHNLDWSGIKEKINLMAATGEKFDVVFTDKSRYASLVALNALTPLNELIDEYGKDIKEIVGEDFLAGSKINGENYAVPVNKEQGHHYGILYQKDIAEKYGLAEQIDNIKTIEELYPVLDIIKNNENTIYPFSSKSGCDDTVLLDFEQLTFPAAFYADSKDGKVVNYIETDEYMEAAKKIHERWKLGYVPKGGSSSMANDKFFAMFYALKPGKDVEMSAKTNWKQVDLTPARMQIKDAMGALLAISKTSENPELVMKFINRTYTDAKLLNMMIYGIEGKHYEKLDENRVRPIKNSGYSNSSYRWEFSNTFNQYLLEDDDEKKNDNLLAYNETLKVSEYLGFNPQVDNIKTQVAACESVRAEFEEQIASGTEDPEVLVKTYRERLKAAGADDVVNEIQRQYDEWKKNNK